MVLVDLKDCFFTVPLHPEDCKKFALSVPVININELIKRYQWKVLPQGLANSPTLCQDFVVLPLHPIRKKYSEAYIIHYMDDILLAHNNELLPINIYII